MIYKNIIKKFDIQQGDSIWLSSELIKLILKFKANGLKFDGSDFLDELQDVLGEGGTILLPTFTFDFSNKGYYDIQRSKGVTGALGNIALQKEGFKRTKHPMHSFAVWGKDQGKLVDMRNRHSFGIDSPFGYCIEKRVKQIILGTDYVHALTFVHYAEVVCNVPYRFAKSFTGTYIDEYGFNEERTYDYAARKLEIEPVEKFNKIGEILEENGVSKKIDLEGIECYKIDLAMSFPLICKDIIENQCANIYDFNIERNRVFNT